MSTRDHDRIRKRAEKGKAKPATVPGTEHHDHLGVLRFDFPGFGRPSNFFRPTNPDREDG